MGKYDKDVVHEAATALEEQTTYSQRALMDDVKLMDPDNPRGLWKIAPPGLANLMKDLSEKWFSLSEEDLLKRVGSNPSLNRVRIAFWKEYDRAQEEQRQMRWADISRMVQMPTWALSDMFHKDLHLAYVLCPVASYDAFLEEALSHGMRRIREILDLPLSDENGKVNPKTGELILKAAAFLDMRMHGGFLQKSMNLEARTEIGLQHVQKLARELNMDEIDKKIRELEANTDVIDVELK